MAAPTAITDHWKSVEIPLFAMRRGTVSTATGTPSSGNIFEPVRGVDHDELLSPAGRINASDPDATGQPAPTYGYDGANPLPRIELDFWKQRVEWYIDTPATEMLIGSFQVPDDIATFDDGVDDYDVACRIEARMVLRGSGTLSADKVMRMRCATENGGDYDSLNPAAFYNFGPHSHATEYTFSSGAAVGDHPNWVLDFTNLRDSNDRPLRPGDQFTFGIWCRQAQQSSPGPYVTIWWMRFRYRAKILGGTAVSALTAVTGAATSTTDQMLIVSGGATKSITLAELKNALDAIV